jgi:ligand-binding sensor domain-containing protein
MRRQRTVIALFLIAGLSACATGQDKIPPPKSAPNATAAKGETVSELDKAIWYVFQAKNNDYWFGSNDRGVYRLSGKTLVNFTVKDGLCSNQIRGIQEDNTGNIYFTTYAGISKFDGKAFTTLSVSASSAPTDWKLQPEDLWFVGPPDAGVVYRYDGKSLHRLEFPKIKAGDDHVAKYPRSEYPNAKFSPYDVYSIFKDSKGNLWFGTAILGVCRYDGKSFAWISENELRNGSFGTRSIIEDKDGRFWFCNTLHRYEVDLSNSAEPKFRTVEGIRDAKDPNRLPFGGVMSSTVDSTGALWMATYGQGVWRCDTQSITHYPVKDGDKAITLFTIHKDNQGVLWLGTHCGGAYKFNGKTFEKFRP